MAILGGPELAGRSRCCEWTPGGWMLGRHPRHGGLDGPKVPAVTALALQGHGPAPSAWVHLLRRLTPVGWSAPREALAHTEA